MCSIILRIDAYGILIGANRDEMLSRPWQLPAAYWPAYPGVIAGRDTLAGGTWMGLNGYGVMAAILNREGTLGPAPGKRSRGELPLLALQHPTAGAAANALATLDTGAYRSFNMVIADSGSAFLLRGLEGGAPLASTLTPGMWMITAGEPNDLTRPRIARHLPKFSAAPAAAWPSLLADNAAPLASALNIPPQHGFGTVCSSIVTLSKSAAATWAFASGPPHLVPFKLIKASGP